MTRSLPARHAVSDTPPDEPTAAQLARARAGDAEVLGTLYRRHASRLLRVAQRITQHDADAEDVVHDVFVGLPVALRHYQARGRFSAWLVTCTVRMALMRRRSQQRRHEVTLDGAWPPGLGPQALSRPDLAPEIAEMEARLAALPDAQRAVLTLRAEGFAHGEIAAALGITEGNSRIRLARALEQMLAPEHTSPNTPETDR